MRIRNKYLEIFWVFFKIGAFTLGGGYAMVPLIQDTIVNQKKWLDDEEFLDALAIAQSIPGILAINTSILTGAKIANKLGMLAGLLGAVLPSFSIILMLSGFLMKYRENPIFIAFFSGIKPVTVALIFIAAYKMSIAAKIKGKLWIIPIIVGITIAYNILSPITILIITIIFGNYYFKWKEDKNK